MRGPKARVIDGSKFMWDGEEYDDAEAARRAQAEYKKQEFETRIVEEDGKVHVYTRRVVTDVKTEGSPPV